MQRETNIRKSQGREAIESAWKLYLRESARMDSVRVKFNEAVKQTQNHRGISK